MGSGGHQAGNKSPHVHDGGKNRVASASHGREEEDHGTLRLGDAVGHYRLVRVLQWNAFGADFLAEDVHHGPRVVLKTVQSELLGHVSAEALQLFLDQIAVVRRINSRLVARPWDDGLSMDVHGGGLAFYALEPWEGFTLRRLLEREHAVAPVRALRMVRQLACGLQAAHEKGVLHLDLGLDNVVVRPRDRVLITGFGPGKIREFLARGTRGWVHAPTPFLAPEVLQGGTGGAAADVYGVGVVLLQLVCGPTVIPTPGIASVSNVMVALEKHLGTAVEVPRGVTQIAQRALAENPRSRHASMQELAEHIRVVLEANDVAVPRSNLSVSTHPVGGREKPEALPSGKRAARPRLLLVLGLVAVMAAISTHAWTWRAGFIRGQTTALTLMRARSAPHEPVAPPPARAPVVERVPLQEQPVTEVDAARIPVRLPHPPPPPAWLLERAMAMGPSPEPEEEDRGESASTLEKSSEPEGKGDESESTGKAFSAGTVPRAENVTP